MVEYFIMTFAASPLLVGAAGRLRSGKDLGPGIFLSLLIAILFSFIRLEFGADRVGYQEIFQGSRNLPSIEFLAIMYMQYARALDEIWIFYFLAEITIFAGLVWLACVTGLSTISVVLVYVFSLSISKDFASTRIGMMMPYAVICCFCVLGAGKRNAGASVLASGVAVSCHFAALAIIPILLISAYLVSHGLKKFIFFATFVIAPGIFFLFAYAFEFFEFSNFLWSKIESYSGKSELSRGFGPIYIMVIFKKIAILTLIFVYRNQIGGSLFSISFAGSSLSFIFAVAGRFLGSNGLSRLASTFEYTELLFLASLVSLSGLRSRLLITAPLLIYFAASCYLQISKYPAAYGL